MSRTAAIGAAAVAAFAMSASLALAGPNGQGISGPFVGYWQAKLTPAQATARGDSRMAGSYVLVLGSNGLYVTLNPLDGASAGKFAVLPNHRLRFFYDIGCSEGGVASPGGGIYSWSLGANGLTLRLVKEGPCSGRTQTLTYPVWQSG